MPPKSGKLPPTFSRTESSGSGLQRLPSSGTPTKFAPPATSSKTGLKLNVKGLQKTPSGLPGKKSARSNSFSSKKSLPDTARIRADRERTKARWAKERRPMRLSAFEELRIRVAGTWYTYFGSKGDRPKWIQSIAKLNPWYKPPPPKKKGGKKGEKRKGRTEKELEREREEEAAAQRLQDEQKNLPPEPPSTLRGIARLYVRGWFKGFFDYFWSRYEYRRRIRLRDGPGPLEILVTDAFITPISHAVTVTGLYIEAYWRYNDAFKVYKSRLSKSLRDQDKKKKINQDKSRSGKEEKVKMSVHDKRKAMQDKRRAKDRDREDEEAEAEPSLQAVTWHTLETLQARLFRIAGFLAVVSVLLGVIINEYGFRGYIPSYTEDCSNPAADALTCIHNPCNYTTIPSPEAQERASHPSLTCLQSPETKDFFFVILKLANTALTLVLLATIYVIYAYEASILALRNHVEFTNKELEMSGFLRSGLLPSLLLEVLLCFVHQFPFLHFDIVINTYAFSQRPSVYTSDSILGCFLFLRLYNVWRWFKLEVFATFDSRTYAIRLTDEPMSHLLAIKLITRSSPRTFLAITASVVLLVSSYVYRVVESSQSKAMSVYYWDALWFSADTMFGLPFVDAAIYPRSILGRVVAVVTRLCGWLWYALLIAVLKEVSVYGQFEVMTMRWLQLRRLRHLRRVAAARCIQYMWKDGVFHWATKRMLRRLHRINGKLRLFNSSSRLPEATNFDMFVRENLLRNRETSMLVDQKLKEYSVFADKHAAKKKAGILSDGDFEKEIVQKKARFGSILTVAIAGKRFGNEPDEYASSRFSSSNRAQTRAKIRLGSRMGNEPDDDAAYTCVQTHERISHYDVRRRHPLLRGPQPSRSEANGRVARDMYVHVPGHADYVADHDDDDDDMYVHVPGQADYVADDHDDDDDDSITGSAARACMDGCAAYLHKDVRTRLSAAKRLIGDGYAHTRPRRIHTAATVATTVCASSFGCAEAARPDLLASQATSTSPPTHVVEEPKFTSSTKPALNIYKGKCKKNLSSVEEDEANIHTAATAATTVCASSFGFSFGKKTRSGAEHEANIAPDAARPDPLAPQAISPSSARVLETPKSLSSTPRARTTMYKGKSKKNLVDIEDEADTNLAFGTNASHASGVETGTGNDGGGTAPRTSNTPRSKQAPTVYRGRSKMDLTGIQETNPAPAFSPGNVTTPKSILTPHSPSMLPGDLTATASGKVQFAADLAGQRASGTAEEVRQRDDQVLRNSKVGDDTVPLRSSGSHGKRQLQRYGSGRAVGGLQSSFISSLQPAESSKDNRLMELDQGIKSRSQMAERLSFEDEEKLFRDAPKTTSKANLKRSTSRTIASQMGFEPPPIACPAGPAQIPPVGLKDGSSSSFEGLERAKSNSKLSTQPFHKKKDPAYKHALEKKEETLLKENQVIQQAEDASRALESLRETSHELLTVMGYIPDRARMPWEPEEFKPEQQWERNWDMRLLIVEKRLLKLDEDLMVTVGQILLLVQGLYAVPRKNKKKDDLVITDLLATGAERQEGEDEEGNASGALGLIRSSSKKLMKSLSRGKKTGIQ